MPVLSEGVLNYLIAIYFAVFAAGFVFNVLFHRRLRDHHQSAWVQLGSATFFNNSVRSGLRSTGFLLRKRYEGLDDPKLAFYGRWARVGFIAIVAFLAFFLVLSIIGGVQNRIWQQHASTNEPLRPITVLIWLLVAVHLCIYWSFERYLRIRSATLWNELGQPSLLNTRFGNSWKMLRFVWGSRYQQLNDWRAGLYVWLIRITTIVFCGVLLWPLLSESY